MLLVALSLGGALPAFITSTASATGLPVTTTNLQGWVKYGNVEPEFVSAPSTIGTGALKLSTPLGPDYVGLDHDLSTMPLAKDVHVSYDTKRLGGPAHAAPAYVLAIDKDGNSATQDYFWAWYEPVYNNASNKDYSVWNNWDITSSSVFWFNGAKPAEAVSYSQTLDSVLVNLPDAKVIGVSLNMGSGNAGWSGLVDNVMTPDATYNFEPVTIAPCTTTNNIHSTNLQNWNTSETRATGHNEVTANGLRVWTESNTSTDKAAGYYAASFNLADLGEGFGLNATGTDAIPPALQLTVDLDGNGTLEGNLVAEPAFYGANSLWLSSNWSGIDLSKAPTAFDGGGVHKGGNVNDWLSAFPNAKVKAIGYSLGSGVKGDFVITKLTAGCTNYTFGPQAPTLIVATPAENSYASTVANSNKLKITGTFTDDVKANYATMQLVKDGNSVAIGTLYGFGSVYNPAATYANADGSYTFDLPVPANLADGQYSLFYTGTDFEGGITSRMERKFTIDNTAPTGVATYAGGNTLGNVIYLSTIDDLSYSLALNDNLNLEHTSYAVWKADSNYNNRTLFCGNWNGAITSVNVSGTSASLTGNVKDCSPTGDWSSGNYVIMHIVYDAAGNILYFNAPYPGQRFSIDSTAPTITVKPGYKGDAVSKVFSEVSFQLYDSNKVDKYVINGHTSDFTNNNYSDANYINVKPYLVQGTNTLTLYDVSGNTTVYAFTYDSTAPEVNLLAPAGVTNANSIAVLGSVTDANMHYYACYITTGQPITAFGKTWSTGQEPKSGASHDQSLADGNCVTTFANADTGSTTSPVTLGNFDVSGLPDGTYTVHVHGHDRAGNATDTATDFIIDRTAPVVAITGYGQAGNIIQPVVTVDGSTSPTGNTYSWSTNPNVTVSNLNALNPSFTANADGTYAFTLTATDQAGNSSSATLNFTYTSPPAPDTEGEVQGATSNSTGNGQRDGQETAGFSPVNTFASTTPQAITTLTDSGDGTTAPEVLGETTSEKSSQVNPASDTVALVNDTQDEKSGGFMGLGWWWIAVFAAVAAIWFFLAARRDEEDK